MEHSVTNVVKELKEDWVQTPKGTYSFYFVNKIKIKQNKK